jgi:hypothetical protein
MEARTAAGRGRQEGRSGLEAAVTPNRVRRPSLSLVPPSPAKATPWRPGPPRHQSPGPRPPPSGSAQPEARRFRDLPPPCFDGEPRAAGTLRSLPPSCAPHQPRRPTSPPGTWRLAQPVRGKARATRAMHSCTYVPLAVQEDRLPCAA